MTYIVSIKVLSMTEEYKELLWILVVLHFISDQNLCSFNQKKQPQLPGMAIFLLGIHI